jgi:hypothetical protein
MNEPETPHRSMDLGAGLSAIALNQSHQEGAPARPASHRGAERSHALARIGGGPAPLSASMRTPSHCSSVVREIARNSGRHIQVERLA